MPLDSDVANPDARLNVEFYFSDQAPYKGVPFVRIIVPGDATNIYEQPATDAHKQRFLLKWLNFQSEHNQGSVAGIPLQQWNSDRPEEFNRAQLAELQVLRFQTVEQVSAASDAQVQRIGMGGVGLREKARAYLNSRTETENKADLVKARTEIDDLKAKMAELLAQRKPGRPRKESADVHYDNVAVDNASHE